MSFRKDRSELVVIFTFSSWISVIIHYFLGGIIYLLVKFFYKYIFLNGINMKKKVYS